jgi:cytochrome c oxidase subunit IV
MSERATFVVVYLVCMVLLAATMGVSFLKLGPFNVVLNMSISATKTLLVAWFFMHVRESSGLVRLASASALFWLLILFGLSLSDYLTRGVAPIAPPL